MKYPKRSQYKYTKSQYRIRNWPEYEAGLKRRGDLTVWLSTSALDRWRAPANGKPGGQRKYSEMAIETALAIPMVFRLPLCQTEGFLRGLTEMLDVELPTPDHTTLSRRLKKLDDIQFLEAPNGPADPPAHRQYRTQDPRRSYAEPTQIQGLAQAASRRRCRYR